MHHQMADIEYYNDKFPEATDCCLDPCTPKAFAQATEKDPTSPTRPSENYLVIVSGLFLNRNNLGKSQSKGVKRLLLQS